MTVKQHAIKSIQDLPDDVEWEDVKERIEFLSAVEKGLKELNYGQGIPVEDIEKEHQGMDFKVIWAPSARLDLKEIVSYIAEDNPEIAQRFGLTLIDATKSLASLPVRGRVVPELGSPQIREVIFKPYRIIYRVKENERGIGGCESLACCTRRSRAVGALSRRDNCNHKPCFAMLRRSRKHKETQKGGAGGAN